MRFRHALGGRRVHGLERLVVTHREEGAVWPAHRSQPVLPLREREVGVVLVVRGEQAPEQHVHQHDERDHAASRQQQARRQARALPEAKRHVPHPDQGRRRRVAALEERELLAAEGGVARPRRLERGAPHCARSEAGRLGSCANDTLHRRQAHVGGDDESGRRVEPSHPMSRAIERHVAGYLASRLASVRRLC